MNVSRMSGIYLSNRALVNVNQIKTPDVQEHVRPDKYFLNSKNIFSKLLTWQFQFSSIVNKNIAFTDQSQNKIKIQWTKQMLLLLLPINFLSWSSKIEYFGLQ